MKKLSLDINEIMPDIHVEVEVRGAWRAAIALRVLRFTVTLLRWLNIDASVTLRSKA